MGFRSKLSRLFSGHSAKRNFGAFMATNTSMAIATVPNVRPSAEQTAVNFVVRNKFNIGTVASVAIGWFW
ncbi:MAG TPA: hypothetical protein VHK27_07085 [Gammaproteobacteria bacterium]|nr:hypothetical protein [Gammaproteobacteria bacterium]